MLFVEGHFKAEVAGDAYRLSTYMETTGLAHRLYPAVYKLMSRGRIAGESIEPDKFISDTVARKDKRVLTLTYDDQRMPDLSATPPYSEDELKDVTPDQQRATQDPVSAFLLPVSASDTPCERTIPIFDDKRRFNLIFAHQGTKKIAPYDTSAPDGRGCYGAEGSDQPKNGKPWERSEIRPLCPCAIVRAFPKEDPLHAGSTDYQTAFRSVAYQIVVFPNALPTLCNTQWNQR